MLYSEPPTERQHNYALLISEKLEIPLPTEFTKRAYSDFINDNANRYKKVLQEYDDEYDDSFDY